jgi:hypothetical protein
VGVGETHLLGRLDIFITMVERRGNKRQSTIIQFNKSFGYILGNSQPNPCQFLQVARDRIKGPFDVPKRDVLGGTGVCVVFNLVHYVDAM